LVSGHVPHAGHHGFQAGGSDEEPQPQGAVQQRHRVGEGRGKQPGVLHAGGSRFHVVGGARLSRAASERVRVHRLQARARPREGLMTMLDQLGTDITWTHVEHPAAELFYDPKNGTDYDAYLFYDAPSRGNPTPQPPNGAPGYRDPGPMAKKNFAALTDSGKPL